MESYDDTIITGSCLGLCHSGDGGDGQTVQFSLHAGGGSEKVISFPFWFSVELQVIRWPGETFQVNKNQKSILMRDT